MPGLKEFAGVLGTSLLAGSGASGRAAATSLLNNRLELAQREREIDMELAQQVAERKRSAYTTALKIAEGVLTDPTKRELVTKNGDLPRIKMLGTQAAEFLGLPNPELIVESFVPGVSSDEGTLSNFGTVDVGGQRLSVAANNKGGVVFTEGQNRGATVPGSVLQSYTPLKPPAGTNVDVKVDARDMTTSTQSALEGKMISSSDALQRLSSIRSKFNSDYLTVKGKAKGAGLDLAEKAGFKLGKENKQYLEDFTDFTVSSIRNINDYIKEVTGAQMSEFEAKRLRRGMPDAGDGIFGGMGPTKFESTLNSTMKDLALANARAKIMREKGLDYDFSAEGNKGKEGPITLGQTKDIINKRGAEIMEGLIAEGKSEKEAEAQAREIIRSEYGI